jgi:hypothetical protein
MSAHREHAHEEEKSKHEKNNHFHASIQHSKLSQFGRRYSRESLQVIL